VTRFPLKVSFRVAYPMGPVTTRTEVIRVVQIGPNDHRRCLTCMSTANPRREVDVVDLSLYLVTGRHLLPPGMVFFLISPAALYLQIRFPELPHFSGRGPSPISPPSQSHYDPNAGSSGWSHCRTSPREEHRNSRGALARHKVHGL
jgi:hypothetical protein